MWNNLHQGLWFAYLDLYKHWHIKQHFHSNIEFVKWRIRLVKEWKLLTTVSVQIRSVLAQFRYTINCKGFPILTVPTITTISFLCWIIWFTVDLTGIFPKYILVHQWSCSLMNVWLWVQTHFHFVEALLKCGNSLFRDYNREVMVLLFYYNLCSFYANIGDFIWGMWLFLAG